MPVAIGGEFRPLLRLFSIGIDQATDTAPTIFSKLFMTDWLYNGTAIIQSIFSQSPFWASFWTLLTVITVLAVLWVMFVCYGSVVSALDRLNRHQSISFTQSLLDGVKQGWTVFGTSVIGKIAIFAILLLLGLPLLLTYLAQTGSGGELPIFSGSVLLLFWLVLYIPLAVIISFITTLAINGVVIMGDTAFHGFKRAFHLFFRHWAECLEWALILLLVDIIVLFAHYMFAQIFLSPLSGASFALSSLGLPWATILVVITTLLWLFIVIFLTVFHTAAWVALFDHFTVVGPGRIISKLYRMLKALL
ncbi:MAG: hypothetical protein V1707_02955 [bacterium]